MHISPTEWSRAVRAIHRLEKARRQLIHLEEVASIAHEILLACDTLNPFAMVRVRCRPKRHLICLSSQEHKCYRKTGFASALQLDGHNGRVRLMGIVCHGVVALWTRRDDGAHA